MENLKEKFFQGQSFTDYLATLKENKFQWQENYRSYAVSPDSEQILSKIQQKFYVLAISEDWCGDSVRNLPVIAKLVENLPQAEMRVLRRDLNLDLMDRYALNGKKKIPTVVFFDSNFKELAVWIEKPANASKLLEQFQKDPDGKEKYLQALKEEVTKEILEMLSTLNRGK